MRFYGIANLSAGDTSHTVSNLNMPQVPVAGRGDVMKQGASAENIVAILDYTSLSFTGGTFYFEAPIPSDSTTYVFYFEFQL